MLDTLFWVLVGALIGWNFPQPAYAKVIQSYLVSLFTKEAAIVVANSKSSTANTTNTKE